MELVYKYPKQQALNCWASEKNCVLLVGVFAIYKNGVHKRLPVQKWCGPVEMRTSLSPWRQMIQMKEIAVASAYSHALMRAFCKLALSIFLCTQTFDKSAPFRSNLLWPQVQQVHQALTDGPIDRIIARNFIFK